MTDGHDRVALRWVEKEIAAPDIWALHGLPKNVLLPNFTFFGYMGFFTRSPWPVAALGALHRARRPGGTRRGW